MTCSASWPPPTASSQLGRMRYAKATAVVLDTSTVRLPIVHQAAGLTPLPAELPRVGSYSAHRLAVNGLDGARRRPHRPHIRHRATLRPRISAQNQPTRTGKPQVTVTSLMKLLDRESGRHGC